MEELSKYLEKQKIREEKKSKGIVSDSNSDEDSHSPTDKSKEETEKM